MKTILMDQTGRKYVYDNQSHETCTYIIILCKYFCKYSTYTCSVCGKVSCIIFFIDFYYIPGPIHFYEDTMSEMEYN